MFLSFCPGASGMSRGVARMTVWVCRPGGPGPIGQVLNLSLGTRKSYLGCFGLWVQEGYLFLFRFRLEHQNGWGLVIMYELC